VKRAMGGAPGHALHSRNNQSSILFSGRWWNMETLLVERLRVP